VLLTLAAPRLSKLITTPQTSSLALGHSVVTSG